VIPGLDLIRAPIRQASTVDETVHRPWPLPADPWVLAQTCEEQLFAHWRVDAAALGDRIPDGLELDRHDGSAWLGITPFGVAGFRVRGTFPLPLVSTFRELNVRTYVTDGTKPGIWFFSLDVSSQLVVEAARRLYKLPFFRADITLEPRRGRVFYECVRGEATAFSGSYRPVGNVAPAAAGSLEHFLTERYCLYASERGLIHRTEIHHRQWPLQPAEATIDLNTMAPDGVKLDADPLLHYSAAQDILIWPSREVE
jgi:uncharacterized protein